MLQPHKQSPRRQNVCDVWNLAAALERDRFGHAAGDAVLAAVPDRLRASVRDADFA
jgi:GGDEF domain-containing protein